MNDKLGPEDKFRSSLQDVVTIARKLALYCTTVEDFINMVHLAVENDGQLRLLMSEVCTQKK